MKTNYCDFSSSFYPARRSPLQVLPQKKEKRKSEDPVRDVVHMDTLPAALPPLHPQPPKKSRFRAERDKKAAASSHQDSTDASKHMSSPFLDPEEMIDKQDRGMATVLSSIIERDTRNANFTMPRTSAQPFPTVLKNASFTKAAGQRQSLFAQQVAQCGVQEFGVTGQVDDDKMDKSDVTPSKESASCRQGSEFLKQGQAKSHIVDGVGLSVSNAEEESQSIHRENVARLSEMSEEDILAEQQRLLQTMDPGLVEFLKSKSKSEFTPAEQSKSKRPEKSVKLIHPKHSKQPAHSGDLPQSSVIEGRKDWVHMDMVEYDKLEWMKDLPAPSADHVSSGQQARFDFQGNIIPADTDVPVHTGLHHHGEEPERAGYSVGELFQLARSTNVQQRVLALTTLANIIQKAKDGLLDDLIQTPIIPSILDAGIIFLLRWACDDSVDAVVAAALSALSALLCNNADEAALDRVSSWFQGCCVPALIPPATIQVVETNRLEEDEDNKIEETDADVAKRDLVQGLMERMMLQQRLLYILDQRQPQAPVVISILSILTRLARHSAQMAYEISRNKKLMTLIFTNFLPTTWKSEAGDNTAVSSVYGRPLAAAMRFVGSLCQAGRHIAASLVSTYSLHSVIMGYLAVSSECLSLSAKEVENLQKESLLAWRILLSYGLATDIFRPLYESLMAQWQSMTSRLLDLSLHQPTERDVLFVSLLEAMLPVVSIPSIKTGFTQSSELTSTETTVTSSVSWSHVEGLCPLVRASAEQSLDYLANHYTLQKPSLQFPAACLNFLATYHTKWKEQPIENAVEYVGQIEEFCNKSLSPFLLSRGFTSIVANISSSSNVLCTAEGKRKEVSSCLPELGCDVHEQRVPVVGASSPVGFLLSLARLTLVMCQIHRHVVEQTAAAILQQKDLLSYLKRVTACAANHLHNNHFTRMETLLHYFLIKLSALLDVKQRPPMMHQLALDVVSRLQDGDEFLAHDLMTSVLFSPDFFPEGQEEELAAASVADLAISKTHFLKSASQEEITTNNSQLLREAFSSLHLIRGHYFKAFAHMEKKIAQSRNVFSQKPESVSSIQTGAWESCLMPRDWVFLPLIELYSQFTNTEGQAQKRMEVSSVPMVSSVLQWVFLLESWRSRSLAHVSVTLKISRLMCVFLAGDQLFLEKSVYPYVASLFRTYTTPRLLSDMNFDEQVPGISSFYDLYTLFLDQYEAVSFGDPLFGAFVLLPMQQCQSCMLRRAVWQERSHLLRNMSVQPQEMLMSMERLLSPEETDSRLLQLYAGALLSGSVRQSRSPVLFLVAVHHLNRFLFHMQDDVHLQLRNSLWIKLLCCKDKGLKEMIVSFKHVNVQEKDGFERYSTLPANRQTVLNQHTARLGLHES